MDRHRDVAPPRHASRPSTADAHTFETGQPVVSESVTLAAVALLVGAPALGTALALVRGPWIIMLALLHLGGLVLWFGLAHRGWRDLLAGGGIHSRTLLRSYDLAWPGSRDDFDIARQPRSALRLREAGPSVQATVRGEAGTVVLGGMSTRALTEPRARYLMEEELDQIWAWAASWGLLPDEDPKSNGPRGGGDHGSSHP